MDHSRELAPGPLLSPLSPRLTSPAKNELRAEQGLVCGTAVPACGEATVDSRGHRCTNRD